MLTATRPLRSVAPFLAWFCLLVNDRQARASGSRRSTRHDPDPADDGPADGAVTLSGKANSVAERRQAEYAAWAAPGVVTVVNEIVIGA